MAIAQRRLHARYRWHLPRPRGQQDRSRVVQAPSAVGPSRMAQERRSQTHGLDSSVSGLVSQLLGTDMHHRADSKTALVTLPQRILTPLRWTDSQGSRLHRVDCSIVPTLFAVWSSSLYKGCRSQQHQRPCVSSFAVAVPLRRDSCKSSMGGFLWLACQYLG